MPGGASAYLTFANENRNAVRDELVRAQGSEGTGKVGIAQLGKELGSRWRQLSEEEKDKYKRLAKEQNERRAAEAKENDGAGETNRDVGASKPPGLPTAVVKRMILSDPELKRISAPALNLVISSAEHFLCLMAQRARDVATTSGKRTIRFQDILAVAREGGWRMSAVLDHLKEVTPLIIQENQVARNEENEGGELDASEAKEAKEAKGPPVRRITDFFGAK